MSRRKKAIIIDDERLARVELTALIKKIPELELIGEAANADEGLALIRNREPELIFLDINMPERSGFDLLEELDTSPPVIFTTAYDEYAIKAFEFNALDYLLKPIRFERLQEAIQKALQPTVPPAAELSPGPVHPYCEHLYLRDGDRSHFVALRQISLFSSFGNYVRVHFDGQTILAHRSLNQLERRLPDQTFFRANRYSIINVSHIQKIRPAVRGKLVVLLTDEQEIELSERRSVLFKEKWSI